MSPILCLGTCLLISHLYIFKIKKTHRQNNKKHLKHFLVMRKIFCVVVCLLLGALSIQAQTTNHIVKKGETLYRLSVQYKVPVNEIKKYNKNIVGDNISVGDVIKIPSKTTNSITSLIVPHKKETALAVPKKEVIKKKESDLVTVKNPIVEKIEKTKKEIVTKEKKKPVKGTVVKSTKPKPTAKPVSVKGVNPIKHKVKVGETLYSISRAYGQIVPVIRNWNGMPDNTINIDQELIVGWRKEEVKAVEKTEGITVKPVESTIKKETASEKATAKKETAVTPTAVDNEKAVEVKPKPKPDLPVDLPEAIPEESAEEVMDKRTPMTAFHKKFNTYINSSKYKSVKQNGIATWFEDGGKGSNMYALHKTAPLRSILKVTNPMNQKSAYVMVIERLPATIMNDNVLVKLTSSAAKKLNILDKKSIVETVFYKKK